MAPVGTAGLSLRISTIRKFQFISPFLLDVFSEKSTQTFLARLRCSYIADEADVPTNIGK